MVSISGMTVSLKTDLRFPITGQQGHGSRNIQLLLKPNDNEQKDIFDLFHRRRNKSSTIFCSQYQKDGWYDQLGGASSPLADAILDRIVHDAYIINIQCTDATKEISMREVYGLDKNIRE